MQNWFFSRGKPPDPQLGRAQPLSRPHPFNLLNIYPPLLTWLRRHWYILWSHLSYVFSGVKSQDPQPPGSTLPMWHATLNTMNDFSAGAETSDLTRARWWSDAVIQRARTLHQPTRSNVVVHVWLMDLLRPSDKQHDSTGNRQHCVLVMESAQLETKHLVISVSSK